MHVTIKSDQQQSYIKLYFSLIFIEVLSFYIYACLQSHFMDTTQPISESNMATGNSVCCRLLSLLIQKGQKNCDMKCVFR